MDKQEIREQIVLRAMYLKQEDMDDLEHFDKMVCEALGVDQDSAMPLFILEALHCS